MTTNTTTHSEFAEDHAWSGRGNLQQLRDELMRQKESRLDFVADTRDFSMETYRDGEKDVLRLCPGYGKPQVQEFIPSEGVPINDPALQQMGQKSSPDIPWRFLRALRETKPHATAELMNNMFSDPNRRLIRCLDGKVRAFLSDRYRILDNEDLMWGALTAVQKHGGEIIEASLSDTKMRLKFTSRQIWMSINEERKAPSSKWYSGGMGSQEHLSRVGATSRTELPGGPGTVHPVVTVTNSETGHGGLNVRVGILRAICFNLATVEDVASRVHLGERLDVGRWSEETRSAESKSIMLKCRDAIEMAFKTDSFAALVNKIRCSTEKEIASPSSAVDNVIKLTTLAEDDRDSILEYFVADYDRNAYGLAQAVSRHAQTTPDGDRAADIEAIAGRIMVQPSMVGVC